MHVESDRFRIEFDPRRVDTDAILRRIRGLGYRPERVDAEGAGESRGGARAPAARDAGDSRAGDPAGARTVSSTGDSVPQALRAPVARARERDTFVLVDFFAEWCSPCRVLEEKVFPQPAVQELLHRGEFVTVDTDRDPDLAKSYGVVALPTLIVLQPNGEECMRHVGPLDVRGLQAFLRAAARCEANAERSESDR